MALTLYAYAVRTGLLCCVLCVQLTPAGVDVRGLRYFWVSDEQCNAVPFVTPLHWELSDAVQRVVQHFGGLGARTSALHLPEFASAFEMWSSSMAAAGGPSFRALLFEGHPRASVLFELLRCVFGRSRHTFAALALTAVEPLPTLPLPLLRARHLKAVAATHALRERLNTALGSDAVLIFPPHPQPAPEHGAALWRPFNFVYTGVFNATELPATACPVGLSCPTSNGARLPLGVQVVGAQGHDHLTIAVALEIERAFGGWQPPP